MSSQEPGSGASCREIPTIPKRMAAFQTDCIGDP